MHHKVRKLQLLRTLKKKIVLFPLIGIIFISLFIIFNPTTQKYLLIKLGGLKNQLEEYRWRLEISVRGGDAAYQKFKNEFANYPLEKQHFHSHLFGKALYEEEPFTGISVCDTSFNYGCYHSFIANAIIDRGLPVAPDLNKECLTRFPKNPIPCQHGLGHGILSYLGYDATSLNNALSVCQSLTQIHPIIGCFEGVFMEFNFRTLLATSTPMRDFDELNPQFPCNSLNKNNHLLACYYQQSSWWLSTLRTELPDRVLKVESLCAGAPTKAAFHQCLKGLGIEVAVKTNFDGSRSKELCNILNTPVSRDLCLAGVGREFNFNSSDIGNHICDALSGWDRSYCARELHQVEVSE